MSEIPSNNEHDYLAVLRGWIDDRDFTDFVSKGSPLMEADIRDDEARAAVSEVIKAEWGWPTAENTGGLTHADYKDADDFWDALWNNDRADRLNNFKAWLVATPTKTFAKGSPHGMQPALHRGYALVPEFLAVVAAQFAAEIKPPEDPKRFTSAEKASMQLRHACWLVYQLYVRVSTSQDMVILIKKSFVDIAEADGVGPITNITHYMQS